MAIIKEAQLYFSKLDPKNPNGKFDPNNPTWEVQIRTNDKKKAKEWEDLKLKVNKDEDKQGKLYYKVNLKKKSKKRDGSDQEPVTVVGGDLTPIDPKTIGNGSIANIRIYQYEYDIAGRKGLASMLMAVQITELHKYEPKPRDDDFEMSEMKVVEISDNQETDTSNVVDLGKF